MSLTISFKHMESSDSLLEFTQDKLDRSIERFHDSAIEAKVTVEKDHHQFIAKIHFYSHGHSIDLKAEDKDAYTVIDSLAQKLERSSRKQKEKVLSKRNHIDPKITTELATEDSKDVD